MSDWRFEKKIPLGSGDLQQVENILLAHPMGLVTAYPSRQVHNVYFDSPDLACFHAHTAGHEARVKWRLRSYDGGAWKQLEEKRKVGDHGDKRFYDPAAAISSLREGHGVLMGENLMYPVLENRYQRRYYHAPAWGVRVTLDTQIEFSPAGRNLWRQDFDYVAVLEIKYDLEAAKVGDEFIRCLPWRLGRFSKYVRGLQLLDTV
jgi:hypothetical protein